MNKLSKLKTSNLRKFSLKSFLGFKSKNFSEDLSMPVIDFKKFLNKSEGWEKECKLTAECLHDTGILVVRDPVRIFSHISEDRRKGQRSFHKNDGKVFPFSVTFVLRWAKAIRHPP